MKKQNKILLGVGITIIITLIIYVVLVLTKVFPNPFLDTKDLVCKKDISNTSLEDKIESEKVFKFNNRAIIELYIEKTVYEFASEEHAKSEYEFAKSDKAIDASLEKNVLTTSITYVIEENKGYYGKTKKDIINIYVEEFGYECK